MTTLSIPGVAQPVSRLILGSDTFVTTEMERVTRMLDAFLAAGGTTIDTAHNYRKGECEKAIGLWLRGSPHRDRALVLTKGCYNLEGDPTPRVNPLALEHDLMTSLERLGLGTIDLYALHRDDEAIDVSVLVDELNRHVAAGRIRRFGASNWTPARLDQANAYAKAKGLQGFSFSSPNFSLAKAKESWWRANVAVSLEDMAWYERNQLPCFSWSSTARGFFTGRYAPEKLDDANMVRVFYNDANWERYRRAESLGKKLGLTTVEVALAYVLNQPFPVAAIIGAQTPAEMESSLRASNVKLTPELVRWLDLRIA